MTGNSISFTDKQTCFNERLKQHHFGNEDRDSFTRVLVSRQELLQSVSICIVWSHNISEILFRQWKPQKCSKKTIGSNYLLCNLLESKVCM